jgi:hypothetical protein
MQSVFSGDIEVSIVRGGREVDRVVRPLRETAAGPVIRFKRQFWPVVDGIVCLDNGPVCHDGETAGSAAPAAIDDDEEDILQNAVISAEVSARLLVDAGPGTGKTFVACSRVAALIRDGVPAGRIWLVSFTRTAIQEIRNRLESYLDDPSDAAAVKIATLDSHAWSIQSGFSTGAKLTGSHNDNIRTTLAHILEDDDVREYLGRVRHLLIDEAQDITGDRASLVLAMIDGIDEDCGVTVFCDRAQAIYGFTEDSSGDAGGEIFIDEVKQRQFEQHRLRKVHRTSDPALLKIFTDVRQQVLDKNLTAVRRAELVRAGIRELAENQAGKSWELDLAGIPTNSLVLARQRADVLAISGKNSAIPHRLRMSGLPPRILPSFAKLFWDFAGRRIAKDEFESLWRDRTVAEALPLTRERTWQLMLEAAGVTAQLVDLHRLRELLGRSAPPVLFTSPEYGEDGPVVGTIHASKGREGDNVYLFLPPRDEDADEEEETRVVYVGATRARFRLSIGDAPGRQSGNIDGRTWKRLLGDKLLIEIGRSGDIDAEGLVGISAFSGEEAHNAQSFISGNPFVQKLFASAKKDLRWNMELLTEGQQRIAVLSDKVRTDLREIASVTKRWPQPGHLAHIRSIGLRTLVIRPDDPVLERLNEPWRSSGFMLAPMLVGFGWSKLKGRS